MGQNDGNYGPFEVSGKGSDAPTFALVVTNPADWRNGRIGSMEPLFVSRNGEDEPQTDLFADGDGLYVETSPNGRIPKIASLSISPDCRKGNLRIGDARYSKFAIDNAAMLMFAFATVGLDTLEMHSSVTVNAGRAYMFLAKSGTGKSTHSRM